MRKLFSGIDWFVFGSVLFLLVMGLAMIRSVAPGLFWSQLTYAAIGLVIFLISSKIEYHRYFQMRNLLLVLGLMGLIFTFIFGAVTRGSVRWLQLGGFTFQPSELVKPLLIVYFASVMSLKSPRHWTGFLNNFLLLLPPAILVFAQPDLGSTMVIIFIWLVMVFAAGLSQRTLFLIILLAAIMLPLGWRTLKDYQKDRINTFVNPFADPLNSGYNMIQAMIAVGSGQLFGRGLGRGTQSHLRFLPERHTDFIFASLSEELGFLGAFFLLLAYGVLMVRILKTAGFTEELFGRLVCLGVFAMIYFQTMVNIGMNLGLVPITGITLPLVSYGGSSLLSVMISLGVVGNIYRIHHQKASG